MRIVKRSQRVAKLSESKSVQCAFLALDVEWPEICLRRTIEVNRQFSRAADVQSCDTKGDGF